MIVSNSMKDARELQSQFQEVLDTNELPLNVTLHMDYLELQDKVNEFDAVIIDTICIQKLAKYFSMVKNYQSVPVKVYYEKDERLCLEGDRTTYNKDTCIKMFIDIHASWRKELDSVAIAFK